MTGHESPQLEGLYVGDLLNSVKHSSRHRTSSPNKYLYQNINSVEVGKPDSERGISSLGNRRMVSTNHKKGLRAASSPETRGSYSY